MKRKRTKQQPTTPRLDDWILRTEHYAGLEENQPDQMTLTGRHFDELYVGMWFAMERMDGNTWYVGLGENKYSVEIGGGTVKVVRYQGEDSE